MYAVIKSGGKQYRVQPGDLVRVEKLPQESGAVEWSEVLAVQDDAGNLTSPVKAGKVTGTIVQHGKAAKILVFHYKRKKQYKKLQGHRQRYTTVRVDAIQA